MSRKTTLTLVCIGAVAAVGGSVAGAMSLRTTAAGSPPVEVAAVERFAVFARPQQLSERAFERTASAREVIDVLTSDDAGVPDAWKPGTARAGIRVLLSGLGESNRTIFAFEASRGGVCAALSDFTSGCIGALPKQTGVSLTFGDPDYASGGEGIIVWGVASSEVAGVRLIASGRSYTAELGNNAYFVQLPDASLSEDALERLVVTRKDGETQMIPIAAGPRIRIGFGG